MLCDTCEAVKTGSSATLKVPSVQVQEDLVSPLVSKRKRIMSVKESENSVVRAGKQQRLAKVAATISQRAIESTQNQAVISNLASRNGKKAYAGSKQRTGRKTRAQLADNVVTEDSQEESED